MAEITWANTVDAKHYDAALAYLSLKYTPDQARELVDALKRARTSVRHAGDILRASRLKPLKLKDPGVQHEADKVKDGKSLQPVLVISLPVWSDIADGYHRVSYAYAQDPFAPVVAKVISPDDLYA